MIRVLLAEDHAIVRNAVKHLLQKEDAIQVVAEALNGNEVLDILNDLEVDILLTDLNISSIKGIELIRQLKQLQNEVKVILLTTHDHRSHLVDAFRAGVHAYLVKNVSAEELVFAIKLVYSGHRYLANELSLQLLDQRLQALPAFNESADLQFTERERSILVLIAEGCTNQEIADRLFASKRTIEGYRQAMIDRTGARNTAALIRLALQRGVI